MDATKYFAYDIRMVAIQYCPRDEGCDARTEELPKVDGPLRPMVTVLRQPPEQSRHEPTFFLKENR